jgi:hypothetical protein
MSSCSAKNCFMAVDIRTGCFAVQERTPRLCPCSFTQIVHVSLAVHVNTFQTREQTPSVVQDLLVQWRRRSIMT